MAVDPSTFSSNLFGQSKNSSINSYLTQSFRDHRQIETFVRSNQLLKVIEAAADTFIKTYQQSQRPEDAFGAVIVKLQFVYADFFSHPLDLLHLAIDEPEQFFDAVKYCVFGIIRDIVKQSSLTAGGDSALNSIDIDQVHVQVRFIGLPLQLESCFEPYTHSYRGGLSLVVGVLSALTEPEKFVIQAVWYCSFGCARNKITANSLHVPLCTNCRKPMSEYSKLRNTQNCHLLRILPSSSVESPLKPNQIFRALTVRVLDHVYDCPLLLGDRYLITGYYDYSGQKQEFQAWNLIKI